MLAKKALYINYDLSHDIAAMKQQEGLQSIGFDMQNIKRSDEVYDANVNISKAKSHIKCLEYAIRKNLDSVLICEDHITFLEPDLLKNQFQTFTMSRVRPLKQFHFVLRCLPSHVESLSKSCCRFRISTPRN